jgi:hypothetical protein
MMTKGRARAKKPILSEHDERLLRLHRLHKGLYARIAKKFNTNASYVSRIANGQRRNEKMMAELLKQLREVK